MLGIVRLTDAGSHGGAMSTASGLGQANGLGICINGDTYNCPTHGPNPVTSTSTTTKTNGQYVLRVGDLAHCGATITGGSSNVLSN